jgi:serine/threonine protein kinase
MHALGVIHRDIKLENIFLDGAGRPKLGDLDMAVLATEPAARAPVGTIFYMAPEVGGCVGVGRWVEGKGVWDGVARLHVCVWEGGGGGREGMCVFGRAAARTVATMLLGSVAPCTNIEYMAAAAAAPPPAAGHDAVHLPGRPRGCGAHPARE